MQFESKIERLVAIGFVASLPWPVVSGGLPGVRVGFFARVVWLLGAAYRHLVRQGQDGVSFVFPTILVGQNSRGLFAKHAEVEARERTLVTTQGVFVMGL